MIKLTSSDRTISGIFNPLGIERESGTYYIVGYVGDNGVRLAEFPTLQLALDEIIKIQNKELKNFYIVGSNNEM